MPIIPRIVVLLHSKTYLMYNQIREDVLFIILFSVVTAMAMMSSCYLLFRQGNAFATEVTPPVRLRRWTAAFFASIALNHVWYMPIFFLSSSNDIMMIDLIGGLLDSMTVFPLAIVVLFAILQDRRRPLWPVAVMMAPLVVGNALDVATLNYACLPLLYIYFLLTCIGLIIYFVYALRQYSRWLRNNYADLEHKEVWQSFVVLAVILLTFGIYAFTHVGPVCQYAMQITCITLISYLLWRVETLSDLSIPLQQSPSAAEPATTEEKNIDDYELPQTIHDKIEPLLQQFCIDTRLYLQHDLTITQLAKTIGTNRLYLSKYFSRQGITYNTYINSLRIQHFMGLYRKAVDSKRPFTARKLAFDSGYRNYTTFSGVFKQLKGQTVTAWMRETANFAKSDFQNQQKIVSESAKTDFVDT